MSIESLSGLPLLSSFPSGVFYFLLDLLFYIVNGMAGGLNESGVNGNAFTGFDGFVIGIMFCIEEFEKKESFDLNYVVMQRSQVLST